MDVVSIDIGFGFTKATNGRQFLTFKSIFGEAREIQYREQLIGSPDDNDHFELEIDGRNIFIGELAERHSSVRAFTLDQDLLIADFAHILALTALSKLSSHLDSVNIVTGLPVAFYRRNRKELIELLKGRHEVIRTDHEGNREKLSINVAQVIVIPQPFGSLFDLIFSDSGEIAKRKFAEDKIGIIDIGFRTADYTIAEKSRYCERGSDTTESGISRAFSLISERLKEKTGVEIEIYRLYEAVEKGSIKIHGQNINLTDIVNQVFSQLASTISGEVNRLWADDWDLDLIVITGGGGAVLAPFLKDSLKGNIMSIDQGSDTRINNARGYWKYGRYHWNRLLKQQQNNTSSV